MSQDNPVHEVQRAVDSLFPDAPEDAWLVVSLKKTGAPLRHRWIHATRANPEGIVKVAQTADIYLAQGLRRPDCTPAEDTRGKNEDVYAIGGLWIDLDHNAGSHAAQNLPTPAELLAFIEQLPFVFSLLVDSGGGYYGYVLFKELWILDTPEERHGAALLLRRFQRTIQGRAAAHGWKVDSTADLARVLRPAGTLNHKYTPPRPVTILHEDAIRYNPSDIAEAPWLAAREDMYVPAARAAGGQFPTTLIEPMVEGCAWLRHCRDDAATLSEPEWYGLLGIVGRCEGGEQIAHEWSAPYRRYTKDETARTLRHALEASGPLTCSTIRFDRGGDDYCRDCRHWGKIKSPIVLGMPHTSAQDAQRRRTGSAAEAPEDDNASHAFLVSAPWPDIAPEAFHGLAGEIVRLIEPHTESDPVALLVQFLAMFGNVVGRTAYAAVEADRHYLNLFVCLVGDTSKGRKGVSAGYPRRVLEPVDALWTQSRIMSGLSSGEGLIWYVRDPSYKHGKDGAENV